MVGSDISPYHTLSAPLQFLSCVLPGLPFVATFNLVPTNPTNVVLCPEPQLHAAQDNHLWFCNIFRVDPAQESLMADPDQFCDLLRCGVTFHAPTLRHAEFPRKLEASEPPDLRLSAVRHIEFRYDHSPPCQSFACSLCSTRLAEPRNVLTRIESVPTRLLRRGRGEHSFFGGHAEPIPQSRCEPHTVLRLRTRISAIRLEQSRGRNSAR
jgi:hypothetical protein